MFAEFSDPKHLQFIIVVLLGVIIALAAGRGLGTLFLVVLKKIIGRDAVTVNIGDVDRALMAGDRAHMADDRLAMAGDRAFLAGNACLIPENCPKCEGEHERSLENKADIAKIEEQLKSNREIFWKELKAIRRGIAVLNNGLLAKKIITPQDLPKED